MAVKRPTLLDSNFLSSDFFFLSPELDPSAVAFRWPSVSLCPRFFSVLIESQGPGSGPEKKGKFRTSADRPFVIWTKVNDHSLPSWTMIAPPLINFGPSLLFPSFPPFRRSSILFYFNFRCLRQKNLKIRPEGKADPKVPRERKGS